MVSKRMVNLPRIVRLVACMTLLIHTRHTISVSAASFVHQIIRTPSLSKSPAPFQHIISRLPVATTNAPFLSRRTIVSGSRNSAIDTRYSNTCFSHPPKRLTSKTMMSATTSSSQEGLSDIGRQSTTTPKNSNLKDNESDDNDFLRNSNMPNWKERIDTSIAKSRKIRGSNYVQISTINYETMEPRCRTVVYRGFLKGMPFGAVKEVLPGCGMESDVEETAGQEGAEGGNNDDGYDCVMKMITDVRSNKVKELEMFHELKNGGKNANTVEMVWWFPKSSEQYRISGRLQFIGSNGPLYSYTDDATTEQNNNYFMAERKQQWGNLSDMAREQFYWEKPGIPHSSSLEEIEESKDAQPPTGGRDEDGKVLPPPDAFLIMLLYPVKIDYLRLTDNYRQIDEWDWSGGGGGGGCHWNSMRVNP